MFLADIVEVKLIPTDGSFLDLLFHHTWLTVNIFGLFDKDGGYQVTLAGLIVILVISLAAAAISERLAGEKPGKNLVAPVLITLLGAYVFQSFVSLPVTDVKIEGVRLISALLGAIVFGVFYVLFRRQGQGSAKKA